MRSGIRLVVRAGQSLGQLIAAGHYDYVDPYLLLPELVSWRSQASRGEPMLMRSPCASTTNEMLHRLQFSDERPADLAELLTYIALRGEAVAGRTLVGLGWFWISPGGTRLAATVVNGRRKRQLLLEPTDGVWAKRDLFLAFDLDPACEL
jgi:hypothetical protein